MIDERLQELAALYALDLLEGAERAAFESELARDADLRRLVHDLRESSGTLALTAPQVPPPPELKARVLAALPAGAAKPSAPPPDNVIRPPAFSLRPFAPWAAAAGFALAAAWTGQLYLSSRAENALLRNEQRLADLMLRDLRQQREAEHIVANRQLADATQRVARLEHEAARSGAELAAATDRISELRAKLQAQGDLARFKIATLVSLAGNSPEALAVAVWNPSAQEGVFKVEKMPLAGADHDYELWVIDSSQSKPVSAGVFAVGADGVARVQFRPESPVATAAKFAVSRERKGGAPAHSGPQGPVLMVSSD